MSAKSKKMAAEIRAKVEKEQLKKDQAEEKKRQKNLTTESSKVIAKIGSLVKDLSKLKKDKLYAMLPGAMQQRHAEVIVTLQDMQKEANDRLANITTEPLEFSLKEVNDAFKAGTHTLPWGPRGGSPRVSGASTA